MLKIRFLTLTQSGVAWYDVFINLWWIHFKVRYDTIVICFDPCRGMTRGLGQLVYISVQMRERKKWKLGTYAMKRLAAGAHLPTPRFFESVKRPDDIADYRWTAVSFPLCKNQVLVSWIECTFRIIDNSGLKSNRIWERIFMIRMENFARFISCLLYFGLNRALNFSARKIGWQYKLL